MLSSVPGLLFGMTHINMGTSQMHRKMVNLFGRPSKAEKQQITMEKKNPKTQEKITFFNSGRKRERVSFSFLFFF